MRLLLLFFLLTFATSATNVVSVSSAQGHPGDEVTITVSVDNDDAICAAEVRIAVPAAVSLVDGSATLKPDRANGHSISAGITDGELRLYVYSFGNQPLLGTEGELCSVRLLLGREPATYPLAPVVMLSDAQGEALPCTTQDGSLTLLSPKINVVNTTIDFDRVPIRSIHQRTLTLRNTGNEPLTIETCTFDNPDFSVPNLPVTIAAGSSSDLAVCYAPTQWCDGITSRMTITSNSVNVPPRPTLTAIPFSVNELHVVGASGICDEEVEISLRVNNMEPLVGMDVQFTLPDQLCYVNGSFACGDRASGLTATSMLDGNRLRLVLYSIGNATISGDDGVIGTFRLRLNGTSGSYRLDPQDVVLSNIDAINMTSATEGAYVSIQSPYFNGTTTLALPKTPVTQIASATYSVYNSGQAPMTIDRVLFLNEGYSVSERLPMVVACNESASFTVQYSPTAEGDYATTMNVYTNDPTHRMVPVAVSVSVFEPDSLSLIGEPDGDDYLLHLHLSNYTEDLTALQTQVSWLPEMELVSATVTERTASHSVTFNKVSDGTYGLYLYSFGNAFIAGQEGEILTLRYRGDAHLDSTIVTLQPIILSDIDGRNMTSLEYYEYMIPRIALRGDVNLDGKVDVTDVNIVVNIILGKDQAANYDGRADVNGSGVVDVSDVNIIVNIILGKE